MNEPEALQNSDKGVEFLLDLYDRRMIRARRALVPSADMAEEAVVIGKHCECVVVDPSAEKLKRVAELGSYQEARLLTIPRKNFVDITHVSGPVELVYDRFLVHQIEPLQVARWAHVVARVLPKDGLLAGLFRIGRRRPQAPPYPVSREKLEHMLARHFRTELFEPAGETPPGRDQVWMGAFRRK
jgi:hypothetical protein